VLTVCDVQFEYIPCIVLNFVTYTINFRFKYFFKRPSWPWSYGSWI